MKIDINIDDLQAGDFSSWITQAVEAIRGEHAADVPCNGCTACCTSSQFIHIEPDEIDTLSCVPAELLFPAPLLPKGHVLFGYDKQGHCPMLIDNHCSIYMHRPRTCRTYDCRIFTATGLTNQLDKERIVEQAKRWKFTFSSEEDRSRHAAINTATVYLRKYRDNLPVGVGPENITELAVLALQVHEKFLQRDEKTGCLKVIDPDPEKIKAEVLRYAVL